MIWFYLFFSALNLVDPRFFFAPLFFYLMLFLEKNKLLPLVVIVFSLLTDLFTVRALGFHGVFHTLFLLAVWLYGQKYNLHNTFFLFAFVLLGSGIYLYLTKIPLHAVSWIFFLLFFAMLSFYTHSAYKQQVRAL